MGILFIILKCDGHGEAMGILFIILKCDGHGERVGQWKEWNLR